MYQSKEKRCDSIQTTKNVLESINHILCSDSVSETNKKAFSKDFPKRNAKSSNNKFFVAFFSRSVQFNLITGNIGKK